MSWKNSHAREVLAEQMHKQWSGWMRHMLQVLIDDHDLLTDGLALGPVEAKEFRAHIERWKRQIDTSYEDLSEKEKDSDREWADKTIDALIHSEDSLRMMVIRSLLNGNLTVSMREGEFILHASKKDADFLAAMDEAVKTVDEPPKPLTPDDVLNLKHLLDPAPKKRQERPNLGDQRTEVHEHSRGGHRMSDDELFTITLNRKQMNVLWHALDNYARMGMGQLEVSVEEFLRHHFYDESWEQLLDPTYERVTKHSQLRLCAIRIKELVFGHPPNGSWGIHNEKVPAVCREAYDIRQVLGKAMRLGGVHDYPYSPTNPDLPPVTVEKK
jgi:ribosome-associated translation inhibitor RaiA